MIVGLLLMLVGSWSDNPIPTGAVWTDEQAREYNKASGELHTSSYGRSHDHSKEHSHGEPDRTSEEYLRTKAAFDKAKKDLDLARSRQSWFKYGIILTGVLISGLGIIRVGMDKMRADEEATQTHRPKKH